MVDAKIINTWRYLFMKLGVFTVPLGGMSLDEACAYLAAKGVQMVEIGCGGCPGNAHCDAEVLLSALI